MSQTLASSTRSRSRTAPDARPRLRPAPAARSTLAGPARLAARASARSSARTALGSPLRGPLRSVAAPVSDRSRTAFVLGCLGLLVGGLFALLLINIKLAEGSFQLQKMQSTSSQLADRSQALTEDIAQQASPEQLAVQASALGMVPSGSVAFLRLSDGRVLGVAKPAPAVTAPTVASTLAPTASATAAATAAPAATSTAAAQQSNPASTTTTATTTTATTTAR